MVPRVRNFMEHELKLDEATRNKWIRHWIGEGLAAMEGHLARDKETGKFAHGDAVTMADICLVSQAAGAGFFKVDTDALSDREAHRRRPAWRSTPFAKAHPLKQPGAPATSSDAVRSSRAESESLACSTPR